MEKTNICLKRGFQVFNVIFGITGGLVFALAVFSHGVYHAAEEGDPMLPGLVFVYILGGVMVALSVLGTFAAWKEKRWALILYCIGMGLLCLALLVLGGRAATIPKESVMEDFMSHKPLGEADERIKMTMELFQHTLDCCGLDQGYQDWGEHLPDSCLCSEEEKNTSICVEVHHRTANISEETIYSQPCIPLLVESVSYVVNIVLAIVFTFFSFAMVGFALSAALLCQMTRRRASAPVTFSVNSKELNYKELCDTAESI